MGAPLPEDEYAAWSRTREEYIDAVVRSPARKKVIVAGPGTGKTFLFRKAAQGKERCLTLTFVNALVEDLSRELLGLSEVRTLHSFARGQLKRIFGKPVRVFPTLTEVIREDAGVLLGEDIDYDQLIHTKANLDDRLKFYSRRRKYYGHFAFSDLVYALVLCFEQNRQNIPSYDQILVDEFQDFNALEVSVIDLLATKTPILIVGDDDQALYESLKHASPAHLRARHNGGVPGYKRFDLPYCSRCPRVIVETVQDVLKRATENACLTGRAEKPFEYFPDSRMDKISDDNPNIVWCQLFSRQIPWFIEQEVRTLVRATREEFTVLIIAPSGQKCLDTYEGLRGKGFRNLQIVRRDDAFQGDVLDGLKLLVEDPQCNLGWRIVARERLDRSVFESVIQKTANGKLRLFDCLEDKFTNRVIEALKALRSLGDKGGKLDADSAKLLAEMGVDVYEAATRSLRERLAADTQGTVEPGLKGLPMRISTFESAKGLAADYVFITHFDDRFLLGRKTGGGVSDQDVCRFVVALTRARRRVYILSTDSSSEPTLLSWVDPSRVRRVECSGRSG